MTSMLPCPSRPWCTGHSDHDDEGAIYVHHENSTAISTGRASVNVLQVEIIDASGSTFEDPNVVVNGGGYDCPLTVDETAELNGLVAVVVAAL